MDKTNILGLTRSDIIVSLRKEYGNDWALQSSFDDKRIKMLRNFPLVEDNFNTLTPKQRHEAIVNMYNRGMTIREIVRATKYRTNTIREVLLRYGGMEIQRPKQIIYDKIQVFNETGGLVAQGTARQVAAKLKVAMVTVYKYCKNNKKDRNGYRYIGVRINER